MRNVRSAVCVVGVVLALVGCSRLSDRETLVNDLRSKGSTEREANCIADQLDERGIPYDQANPMVRTEMRLNCVSR